MKRREEITMIDCSRLAEGLSAENFINCVVREMLDFYLIRVDKQASLAVKDRMKDLGCPWLMVIPLKYWEKEILVPLRYYSHLGAHRIVLPIQLRTPQKHQQAQNWERLDFTTLIGMVLKEIAVLKMKEEEGANGEFIEALFSRILHSKEVMTQILKNRYQEKGEGLFRNPYPTFLESEQGLWAGHPFHPTPKSREGWSELEREIYSAEMGGKFSLHYFLVHRHLVQEGSALPESASSLVSNMLFEDPELRPEDRERVRKLMKEFPQHQLYPLHPWQAKEIVLQRDVQEMIKEHALIDVGPLGRPIYPTSSQRTLFHPEWPYMIKVSLGIKITNSKRTNLFKELVRSLETQSFLESSWGKDLKTRFPNFRILTDPAYLAVSWKGRVLDEFSMVFRENPFCNKAAGKDNTIAGQGIWMLAALCQHVPESEKNPLFHVLSGIAERENKGLEEVALTWFETFLNISLRPYLEIHYRYGYAFEAHQQNTLVELDSQGYPQVFFYRDNQGCFHRDTIHEKITELIPGLGEESESYGPQALVEERMIYYFLINNVFTVINAIGVHGLVREEKLLKILSLHLKELLPLEREHGCGLIQHLMEQPTLLCKGNLLTRFFDMDELIGDPATQSVYMEIPNPFYWLESKGALPGPSESCSYFSYFHPTTGKVKGKRPVTISFRPFQLERQLDLELVHHWMNKPYVAEYWNLNKDMEEIRRHFIKVMENSPRHMTPYIGMMDGQSMSYWERYWVKEDVLGRVPEVQKRTNGHEFDQGLHLLIGEETFLGQDQVAFMIAAFCRFLFQEERTQRVFGEPDARNHRIIKYAGPLGFDRLGEIQLPQKRAMLLECTRTSAYIPDWFSGLGKYF